MKGLSGNALAKYKQRLVLLPHQHQLLIGLMLGDGNLRFPGRSHHANLTVDHGDAQKEYVWWKYEQLQEWVLTPPAQVRRIFHKDPSRITVSWRFSTVSHPALTFYHELFYRDGLRIVPKSINDLLTEPQSLAVWLMDDGSRNTDVLFISTENFSVADQELLRGCLWERFGIASTLNFHSTSNGRRLYRLRLTREGSKKARDLVAPFVFPSLAYKFSMIPL
jgi:hypothetical protein